MRVALLIILMAAVAQALPDYSGIWVCTSGLYKYNSVVWVHDGGLLTVVRTFANNSNVDRFVLGKDFQQTHLEGDQALNQQTRALGESRFLAADGLLRQDLRVVVFNPDRSQGYQVVSQIYRLHPDGTRMSISDGMRMAGYTRLEKAESEVRHDEGTFVRRSRGRWDQGRGRLRIRLYNGEHDQQETLTFRFQKDSEPYRHNLKDVRLETQWGETMVTPDRAAQPNLIFVPIFDGQNRLRGVRFRMKEPVNLKGRVLLSVWAEIE